MKVDMCDGCFQGFQHCLVDRPVIILRDYTLIKGRGERGGYEVDVKAGGDPLIFHGRVCFQMWWERQKLIDE